MLKTIYETLDTEEADRFKKGTFDMRKVHSKFIIFERKKR